MFGIRIPSFRKSIAARLSLKRKIVHSCGIKMPRGLGFLRSPKRAAYNFVYNRTTVGLTTSLGLKSTRKKQYKPKYKSISTWRRKKY